MIYLSDFNRDNPLDNDIAVGIHTEQMAALGEIRDELRALTRALCIHAALSWGNGNLSPNDAIPLAERFVRDAHAAQKAEAGRAG